VQAVFDRPELRVELDFRPGQIQIVNNRSTGHARTAFEDHEEPDRHPALAARPRQAGLSRLSPRSGAALINNIACCQ